MPDRAAPPLPPDPFAEVKARFGQENLEAILATYRAFADRVDYRALMTWTIKQPLEDLLQPLFLAALITVTKELRLGERAAQLDAPFEGAASAWAVRFTAVNGRETFHEMPEQECRDAIASIAGHPAAARWSLMRRQLGPWTEAA